MIAQCSTLRHLASSGLGASGSAITSVYRRLSVSYATLGGLLTCSEPTHPLQWCTGRFRIKGLAVRRATEQSPGVPVVLSGTYQRENGGLGVEGDEDSSMSWVASLGIC